MFYAKRYDSAGDPALFPISADLFRPTGRAVLDATAHPFPPRTARGEACEVYKDAISSRFAKRLRITR
jgi:hypothetical protein